MLKVAINGFGRIGRMIAREYYSNPEFAKKFKIVAINDTGKPSDLAFIFKHDSTHGKLNTEVSSGEDFIQINGDKIPCMKQLDPAQLPWKQLGVDVVWECTGKFVDREGATKHLTAGAKKVIISAPGKSVDLTVVMGVNHNKYSHNDHHILSNASCTTNCLAPVAHVIHREFGIERGLRTTVHSYTSDQKLLDNTHKDLRRARAAAINMVPTSTGAAKTVGEVIPELKGKLDGLSVRVPTPDVSFTDMVFQLQKNVSKDEINAALTRASETPDLKGVLRVTNEPLVSSDYIGDLASSTVDLALTYVIPGASGTLVKICAWYDNEMGFSARMLDLTAFIASK
jgi:glyceraldehyde 3-phosphate dehydrogenase